jgi:hypothetical protein
MTLRKILTRYYMNEEAYHGIRSILWKIDVESVLIIQE